MDSMTIGRMARAAGAGVENHSVETLIKAAKGAGYPSKLKQER